MSDYYEFDETDAFTTGALGQPGQRTFVIQVRADGSRFTMKCEKQQVAALSQYIRQLLADAPEVRERPMDEMLQLPQPQEVNFTIGTVGIAYDPRNDRMVIQIEELVPFDENEEPIMDAEVTRIRLNITRGQAVAFCDHADEVVAAGRPPCIFCGRPMNIDGHMCPRMN